MSHESLSLLEFSGARRAIGWVYVCVRLFVLQDTKWPLTWRTDLP